MADYFKISRERLKGFADQARRLGEVTGELIPEQIEDTLRGIEAGGGSAPDGTNVTFGNVDGVPVEREEAYAILSVNLNELGRITQAVAGTSELMTIDEMLYHLDRAKFIPQGTANSVFDMGTLNFETNAVGELTE